MQKLTLSAAFVFSLTATTAFAGVPAPDFHKLFIEGSGGNAEYGGADNIFKMNNGFGHAPGIRGVVGIDFKRSDNNRVSLEAFGMLIRKGSGKETYTDVLGSYEETGEISLNGTGAGFRFAKGWDDLYLYARGGVLKWNAKASVKYSGININAGKQLPSNSTENESGYSTYLGVGGEWFLFKHFYIGTEYSYYPINLKGSDIRIGVISANAGIYF